MRLLFLGGTRFIGLHAVRRARERGHEVTVVHRGRHNSPLPEGVTEIPADRLDSASLAAIFKRVAPDVVVDTCAMTEQAARSAVSCLLGTVGHVVVLSSQDVYAQFGRLNGLPAPVVSVLVDEQSPLTIPYPFRGLAAHDGGDEYDKKLVEAEYRAACNQGLGGATVLRLPAVYGSGDYQKRFLALVDLLDGGARRIPCQQGASWRWSQAHVRNVAHAIILAAEQRLPGFEVLNVGEAPVPTMRERVETLGRLMGVSFQWEEAEELPDSLSILGKMPNDFVASTAKIRARLGYAEILDAESGYLDLIEWARAQRRPTK